MDSLYGLMIELSLFYSKDWFNYPVMTMEKINKDALLGALGGTTGTLISASKYAVARTFQNGDIYEIGYRLSATV